LTLAVHPGEDGELGWDAFDVHAVSATSLGSPTDVPDSVLVPGHLRFPGMPNLRFWDFETAKTDFGDISVNRRDLVKMLIVDFALVHGVDWYMIPLDQNVGTFKRITSLTVRDVFGMTQGVAAADAGEAPSGVTRWSMFRTTRERTDPLAPPPAPPDFLFLPPSTGPAVEIGNVIEDVRFARDETANIAWGIERLTPSGIGAPRPGAERDAAVRVTHPDVTATSSSPLLYQIGTTPPVHWVPLMPIQSTAGSINQVDLQVSSVLREANTVVAPAGRLLKPAGVSPYRIREEEVPRAGFRLQRVQYRSRGFDGSTHIWMARRRLFGSGETQSGLRWDSAVRALPPQG
jgi:hypothetical protein